MLNKVLFCYFLFILFLYTLAQFNPQRSCYCKCYDAIESCPCDKDSIDVFNNEKIYPALQAILQKDPFKFYKVNMAKRCPFWIDDYEQCATRECGIGYCDDEVPLALKKPATISTTYHSSKPNASDARLTNDLKTQNKEDVCVNGGRESNTFDPLDITLSDTDKAQIRDLDTFEANSNKFCDIEDEPFDELHYVNLAKNQERYTGYKGNSAQKVWKCIYNENCFKPDPKFDKNFLLHPTQTGMCLEKRVFYRLISGLHSAITISIASHNYKPANGVFEKGTWFRNTKMFKDRFSSGSGKEGPERLKNVYFTYMLELRALVKAMPYIRNSQLFYTGNEEEDVETRQALNEFFDLLVEFPNQFDETQLFSNFHESHARLLREEFRQHFWNISRIMDCVGCDKCRLWGKVQTHGMGTALKILFADLPRNSNGMNIVTSERESPGNDLLTLSLPFKLTRNDIVALFQSFGRYSASIWEINQFRYAGIS